MPYFESFDQTQIHYEIFPGELPHTLFFLHGWTAKGEFYVPLKEHFQGFNLIFWDARSHGKSQTQINATVEDMAKDFHYFLHHIYSLPFPITAVGHSMGALTLFEHIKKFGTDKISKLVIVDQSPKLVTDESWNLGIYGNYTKERNEEFIRYFTKDVGEGVILLNANGLNEEYKKLFAKHPEFLYKRKRQFNPEENKGLVSIWKTLTETDFRPAIPKIDIPTLLLYGAKSQYYLKETGEYMQKNLKVKTKLVYFKKGDHSPFVQHPQEFCEEIKNFVLNIS